MSRIVIVGGHGRIALHLARLLVAQGHDVTSFIRNAQHRSDVAATGAAPVVADVERLGPPALRVLLAEHDAVVWSAGAGGGDPERTYAVDRDAAVRTVDAAQDLGVRRFVMVSYKGARVDHGVAPEDPFFAYAESKAVADAHLRASTLDWTILAPGTLSDEPGTGLVTTDESGTAPIPREDVAAAAAQVLADPATIHRTIPLTAGDVPLAEAF